MHWQRFSVISESCHRLRPCHDPDSVVSRSRPIRVKFLHHAPKFYFCACPDAICVALLLSLNRYMQCCAIMACSVQYGKTK